MIDKPSILITSLGRTGTEFFARLFAELIPDSTCLHEPDVFQYVGVQNRANHLLGQIRRAGPWRMVMLKGLGKWMLVKLSDARFLGQVNQLQAARELDEQRKGFIASLPGSVYVEANIGYYGLLDIAPQVFREHRAIYIVRDGREWLRSHMNWGEFYGKRGFRRLISHNWPEASAIPNDPCAEEWSRFSRFEKLCWAWSRLNTYALSTLESNPNARLFHFEQIFSGPRRYETLDELIRFATALPGIDGHQIGKADGWLERKGHSSAGQFPAPEAWTEWQRLRFAELCGPLMERLGYDLSKRPEEA